MSVGERDLVALLANASPTLHPAPVAVATIADGEVPEVLRAHAIGTFRETEGLTVYLDAEAAEAAGLRIVFRAAWITMTVHSDLEAVGFTAAFAHALAVRGIAANVVAGAFHDHVFVPWDSAQDAMKALNALQGQAISTTPPGSGATKSSDAIPARASASARRRGGSS